MSVDKTRRHLQAFLWNLAGEVMCTPTQQEIDQQVCEELQSLDRFDGVWICSRPPAATPRTVAGRDVEEIDRIHAAFERADAPVPWVQAVNEREGVIQSVPEGTGGSTLVLGWVPLNHRRINYGVLTVATESRPPTELQTDVEVLTDFGGVVGHVLATGEMQTQGEVFRQAIEQAEPAIAILDVDGIVEYVNAAFESVFGYTKSDVVGSSLERFVSDIPDEVITGGQGRTPWRDEVVCHQKSGRRIHVDLSVAAVPIEGGLRQKYVAVASDITPLKEHQQRIQVLNRVLRHNLRNDLNVVRGHISYVMREVESGQVHSLLDTAIDNVDSLITVGEKARYIEENVKRTTTSTEVDVVRLLERLVERFEQRHSDVDIECSAPDVCRVVGNNLEPAFREVLANAIEHNDSDQPRIAVRVSPDAGADGLAEIAIADDGPGIPEIEREVLQKERETELSHGSSLGLWLVKWLVSSAGGRITIEESEMGGSLVRIQLRTGSDQES